MTQGLLNESLADSAKDDESLEGQDLVLWYTLATTHIPRPEEWPVTNVTRIGFQLRLSGFFERNPALNVAR
jgi:primary-amine oxidase